MKANSVITPHPNIIHAEKIRWQFRDAYLIINGKQQREVPFYTRKVS